MHQKKSRRRPVNPIGFAARSCQSITWTLLATLFGTALCTLLAACTPSQPAPLYPTPAHHTAEGFRNNYAGAVDKPLPDLLRWRWAAWRDGLPPEPRAQTPVQAPDLAFIHANAAAGSAMQPAVTWIGHASALVQAGGLNVLTDPVFSERASPVQLAGPQRQQPPGIAMRDLPSIDVVLISHNHFDHLDRNSVFALNQRSLAKNASGLGTTLFLVPLGLKTWFADIGISNVVELDWWQKHSLRGVDFHLTPVQHWSTRTVLDKNRSLWGGWAIFTPGFRWYFSGDTGYSRDFADINQFFSKIWQPITTGGNATDHLAPHNGGKLFNLALIAIGAYQPRWFMAPQHVNPDEAVRIHLDLGAAQSIGIHWGTFNLTDEALDQPPIDLAAARRAHGLRDSEFSVLKIGQTRQFATR